MRLLPLISLLGAVALSGVTAIPADTESAKESVIKFDGIEVPPVAKMTPQNADELMQSSKYVMIKHYSPYCHHCKKFAPTYQTLYEFYYTSTPPGETEPATFGKHYNFTFAELDCVVNGDLCTAHDIKSYPTTMLYKDGKKLSEVRGGKPMDTLAKIIEEALEADFPGTRPKDILYSLPAEKAETRPTAEEIEAKKAKAIADDAAKEADKAKPKEPEVAKEADKAKPKEPEKAKGAADGKTKPKKGIPTPPKAPPKPTTTPNPNGVSVSLNAETFQALVTTTQEPWFIKFYAPWCHHCQAMAANWEQLAKEMKGKLNVGEVNCEKESRLCKDAHVKGYPTVLFFRGGERVEYEGLRGLGDFVQYADKAIEICNGVQDVNAASFAALEEKEEVIFLYFYDFASTTEDFLALERLPLSLIGHAKLVKTNDTALYDRFKITTWPRLLVSREGRPTYYPPLTPGDMRDTRRVLPWMKSVWQPMVPELTAANAREIMDGKLVVLGILKREDHEAFASATREMKSAANEWMDKQIQLFQLERQELRDAKQLRIEEAEDRNDQRALRAAKSIRINMDKADKKEVAFAWVDGVFWQRWVRTTYGLDVKDGERVIINDEDNRRYWDQTITGNPILPSRTSILETLNKVTASPPKIKPKLTISSIEKIFFDMRVTSLEHPYLTIGCVLGLSLGVASWFRGRVRRQRGNSIGGHFRPDDNMNMKDFKLPLLGSMVSGSNGNKVD